MEKEYKSLMIVKHVLLIFLGFAILVFSSGCGSNTNSKSNLEIALSSSILRQNWSNLTLTNNYSIADLVQQYIYYFDGEKTMVIDEHENTYYYETISKQEQYYYIYNGIDWYKVPATDIEPEGRNPIILLRLLEVGDLEYDKESDQYYLRAQGLENYFNYLHDASYYPLIEAKAVRLSLDGTHVTSFTCEFINQLGATCIDEYIFTNFNETTVTLPSAIDVMKKLDQATSYNYDNLLIKGRIYSFEQKTTTSIEIQVDHNTYMVTSSDTVVYLIKGNTKEEYRVVYQDEDDNWIESDFYEGATEIFGYVDFINALRSEMFIFGMENLYYYQESYNEELLAILNNGKYRWLFNGFVMIADGKIKTIEFDTFTSLDSQQFSFNFELSMYQTIKIEVPET